MPVSITRATREQYFTQAFSNGRGRSEEAIGTEEGAPRRRLSDEEEEGQEQGPGPAALRHVRAEGLQGHQGQPGQGQVQEPHHLGQLAQRARPAHRSRARQLHLQCREDVRLRPDRQDLQEPEEQQHAADQAREGGDGSGAQRPAHQAGDGLRREGRLAVRRVE